MSLTIQAIGTIRTPYKQKFAIPRQPGLVKSAQGTIQFNDKFNDPNYLRGIENFSHLWLIFQFHRHADQGHSPLVRPPRLGGNQKLGVFATRSTFRPNGLGMSVVEFVGVEYKNKQLNLMVSGMDLLDGTPIIDIKPYIPYADHVTGANGGFASTAPQIIDVEFSAQALNQLKTYSHQTNLPQLIQEVLGQDPRPAYHKDPNKVYAMNLYQFNIKWQVIGHTNQVLSVEEEK